jgi:stage II sporulation protein D
MTSPLATTVIDILRVRTITATIAALTLAAPAIDAARAEPMMVISGAGFGHGVGMSQWGAYGFAKHGFDYRTILAHYYSGTAIGSAPTGATVRVLLQADRRSISFIGGNTIGRHQLTTTTLYRATAAGRGRIALRGPSPKPLVLPAPLTIATAAPFTLRGRAINGVRDGRYRGALLLRIAPSGRLDVIDSVDLEDYVRGVVAAEADPSWPQAALQAQAVAARTYAITTSRSASRGFDQYPDTRSQQYGGVGAETAASDTAVSSTRGQIVVYGDKPAVTYFFDSSGGMTENVENVFLGSSPEPWLRAVADPYDDSAPHHAWGPLRFTLADAQRRLTGIVKGTFQGIDVTKRGASPRVVTADIVGSGGRTSVTGPQLKSRFGLFDTWASFAVTGPDGSLPPGFGQLPGPGNNPSPGPSGGTAADVGGGASTSAAAVAGGVAAG